MNIKIFEVDASIIKYDDEDIDIDSLNYLCYDMACYPRSGSGYCGCNSNVYPYYATYATKDDCDTYKIVKYISHLKTHDNRAQICNEHFPNI